MRAVLFLFFLGILAGCDPDWGGNSTTTQLDDSLLEGCYRAEGLPDLRFEARQVRSGGSVIYDRYDYVRAGRDSAPVVIVHPRNALVKSQTGEYGFEQSIRQFDDTFSYEIIFNGSELNILIVSSPDTIQHNYKRIPCQN